MSSRNSPTPSMRMHARLEAAFASPAPACGQRLLRAAHAADRDAHPDWTSPRPGRRSLLAVRSWNRCWPRSALRGQVRGTDRGAADLGPLRPRTRPGRTSRPRSTCDEDTIDLIALGRRGQADPDRHRAAGRPGHRGTGADRTHGQQPSSTTAVKLQQRDLAAEVPPPAPGIDAGTAELTVATGGEHIPATRVLGCSSRSASGSPAGPAPAQAPASACPSR